MKTSYMIISDNTKSGKYTVSANKAILGTNVTARRYYNGPTEIIKKDKTRLKTETMSNINLE